MIYTSYFAKLRKIPPWITPIAICGGIPTWYSGLSYKALAPQKDFFNEWRKNHDNAYYVKCYNDQVLGKLEQHSVIEDLMNLSNGKDIVLVCYEKPMDFCHRHIVADWLSKVGYTVEEYE